MEMIKLSPKGAKFCPGCPRKDLQLKSVPQLVINLDNKKPDTKVITLTSKPDKKIQGLF